METIVKRLYEGLFLVDSALAASDWEGVNAAIKKVFERNDADVVSMEKWDERKLAYDVEGKERGTYILTYFNAPGLKIKDIERDVQLSEMILRVMVIRADRMPQEIIEKLTPAKAEEKKQAEAAERAEAAAKAKLAEEAEAAAKAKEEAVEEPAEAEAAETAEPTEEK